MKTAEPTYRIQIVRLPAANPGFFGRWWFGMESTALLFNLEIPEGDVLALIRSSTDYLLERGLEATVARKLTADGLHEQGRRLAAAVADAHGVEAPPPPTEFENPSGPPRPPKNTSISKGT